MIRDFFAGIITGFALLAVAALIFLPVVFIMWLIFGTK